jgi:predicted permease
MRWLYRLVFRARFDRQLEAELRHHIEEDAARLVAEGEGPEEARRLALARFGGLEPIKERARDARGTRWLEDLVRDARYALRLMRRSPVFTLAAVGSLAIGLGANIAIFSVVDALLLRSLPVRAPEELYFLEKGVDADAPNQRFSYPLLRDLQQQIPQVQFAGSSSSATLQLTIDGAAELAGGQLVSGNWFDVLGLRPPPGRLLTAADDMEGRPPVVVLSDAFWARRFGSDPAVAGRSIRVNGQPATIVGVAPRGFDGLIVGTPIRLWATTAQQQPLRVAGNASNNNADSRRPWIGQHGMQWLAVVARVPAGLDPEGVVPQLAGPLRHSNEVVFGDDAPEDRERRLRERAWLVPGARGLSPLRAAFADALWVLMATVALVLLVACASLASLLLARNTARARELTVRLAIGARSGRLVRQLLTESVLLSALGGAAGLVFARWAAPVLPRLALGAPSTASPLNLPLDGRLLAFAIGASLLTGVLFGLAPALRWSRPGVHDALRPSARVVGGRQGFARGLVVAQVALALMLLVGAALFVRTFRNYLSVDAGFDRERVVTARFDPRLAAIDETRLPALYERLLEEAGRLPGVRSATLAVVGGATGAARISSVVIEGYEPVPGEDPSVHEDYVGPRYFETVGMPIRRGRDFTDRDDVDAPEVAIVNETMARRYFGDRDPLGRRFGYGGDRLQFEIVGVVADARVNGLREAPPPMAYFPLRQSPQEYARNLYVRAAGSPEAVRGGLRAAVAAAEPNLAVREVVTLAELTMRSVATERLISSLVSAFSGLALVVACLGLYGTLSYSVARRTKEIGVRLALGAPPSLVRRQILRESALLVALGCLVGLAIVPLLARAVATLLFGLSPYDLPTFAGATVTLVVVALAASAVPAWRASRVDPLDALRTE